MNPTASRYSTILSQYSWAERLLLVFALNLEKLLARLSSYLESKRAFHLSVERGWPLQRLGDSNLIRLTGEEIGPCSVTLRRGTSDFAVFEQCLIEKHYEPVVRVLRCCVRGAEPLTIVDAGANIGLSVLYFGKSFPGARIVALEPDKGNFAVCCKNVTNNGLTGVTVMQEALWKEDARLTLQGDFRDRREWSIRVNPLASEERTTGPTVAGVSLPTLFRRYDMSVVDLLKIDIEGAEKQVFGKLSDVDIWLANVRVVAVEVHDADGHELILPLLQRHNFFVFMSGELTIGVNKRLTDQTGLLEYFRLRSEVQAI